MLKMFPCLPTLKMVASPAVVCGGLELSAPLIGAIEMLLPWQRSLQTRSSLKAFNAGRRVMNSDVLGRTHQTCGIIRCVKKHVFIESKER